LILSESVRMRAYSEDLRLKVLDAVDRGMPRKEVARVFGISLPSIKRWLKRRRETGRVGAKVPPGPPAIKGRMLKESGCPAIFAPTPTLPWRSTARRSRRLSG
jgi:transposase-like protein